MSAPDIDKIAREIADDTVASMREQADRLLARALELAPEQTGALKRSGRRDDTDKGGRVAFGVHYATDAHENPASSGHKFLERAAQELSGEIAGSVADGVRRG